MNMLQWPRKCDDCYLKSIGCAFVPDVMCPCKATASPSEFESLRKFILKFIVTNPPQQPSINMAKGNLKILQDGDKDGDPLVLYQVITNDGPIPSGSRIVDGICMFPIVRLVYDSKDKAWCVSAVCNALTENIPCMCNNDRHEVNLHG